MSQASAAAPPPPAPAAAPAKPTKGKSKGAGKGGAAAQSGQPATNTGSAELAAARGIPSALVRLRLIAALAVLVFTGLTAAQLMLGVNAAKQSAADAQQVIRVQDLKADLLRADALATNAFLVGGLEPADRRAAYDSAIADATKEIAAAAQAQPLDQAALAELSGLVVRYAADMEVARANNRQGLPVGAAYLRASSAELRDRGMGLVDALLTANSARADRSLADQHPIWVAIPGVIALAVLVWVNQWLSKRFRRRLNVGVSAAAIAVLALTIAAVTASAAQSLENAGLVRGDYAELVSAADARSAANAAKSSESLRLIARGSGKAFEDQWAANAATVAQNVASDLSLRWQDYVTAHKEVVALDDAGDWDGAVALATAQDKGTSPAFTEFDDKLGADVAALSERVSTTLSAGAQTPIIVAILTVLAGLAATWGAWSGVSRRLEEYS